jgi:hypothetical protein
MKALVVYESMYGNTRTIAEAIGSGLGAHADVVPVREAAPDQLAIVELLVVGGPTHVRGLSQPATRQAARDAAGKPGSTLTLESDAGEFGLREWFASLGSLSCQAAAFDTRVDMPAIFAGRASVGIARLLRSHGHSWSRRCTASASTTEPPARGRVRPRPCVGGRPRQGGASHVDDRGGRPAELAIVGKSARSASGEPVLVVASE